MPFTNNPGSGTELDPYLIAEAHLGAGHTLLDMWNAMSKGTLENPFYYKFDNGGVADLGTGQISRFTDFYSEIDLNGHTVLGNLTVTFGLVFRTHRGMIKNGNLAFNLSYSGGALRLFNLTNTGKVRNVEMSGNMVTTGGDCVVIQSGAGTNADRGIDNLLISGNLEGDNVMVVDNGGSWGSIRHMIFTGVATSPGDILFQVSNAGPRDCFWDATKNPTMKRYSSGQYGAAKTTAELQALSTFNTLYNETQSGEVTVNEAVVTYVSGTNFTGLVAGNTFYLYNYGQKVEILTVDSATQVTLTAAPLENSLTPVTGENLGTGDGIVTIFPLANSNIVSTTDTVYIDGAPTVDYTINLETGEVTFNTAPALSAVITANYSYTREFSYSIGTGSFGLSEVYDIAELGLHNNEVWAINDGIDYPVLGVLIEVPAGLQFPVKDSSGAIVVDAMVQFFEVDSFDASNPVLVNPVLLGGAVLSDIDGNATYEGAFDATKVQGAISYRFVWDAVDLIYKPENFGWGLLNTNITHTAPA